MHNQLTRVISFSKLNNQELLTNRMPHASFTLMTESKSRFQLSAQALGRLLVLAHQFRQMPKSERTLGLSDLSENAARLNIDFVRGLVKSRGISEERDVFGFTHLLENRLPTELFEALVSEQSNPHSKGPTQ